MRFGRTLTIEEAHMTKVLVLYYSAYDHIETMAYAEAEGARAAGATVDVKRVPETVPEAVAKASGFKLECSGSPPILANGKTTIERRGGADFSGAGAGAGFAGA